MSEFLVIISTAIIVSLDSFVAGFSMSLNKRANSLPAAVAIVTLILCLITTFIGSLLKNYLYQITDIFGASILVCLAVINLFKRDEQNTALKQSTLWENLAVGFAVGMDAAVANLSLAVDGYGIIAPLIFSVTHFFTVFAGQLLSKKITLEHTNIFVFIILLALAAMKLL